MKIRPFLTRRKANYINDLLQSAKVANRDELKREAAEFEQYVLEMRRNQHTSSKVML